MPAKVTIPMGEPGKAPPTPETIAMAIYDQLVAQINKEQEQGRMSAKTISKRLRDSVISALATGTHAQRFADALLLDLYVHESIDIRERQAFEKAAKILRGEIDPRPIVPAPGPMVDDGSQGR